MTQTNRQKWRQLQRQSGDRERYFKSYQFAIFELEHLTGQLARAINRDVACDEKGLASGLRYIAEECDGRTWRLSLRIIAKR
jgi:hypothetical protein